MNRFKRCHGCGEGDHLEGSTKTKHCLASCIVYVCDFKIYSAKSGTIGKKLWLNFATLKVLNLKLLVKASEKKIVLKIFRTEI